MAYEYPDPLVVNFNQWSANPVPNPLDTDFVFTTPATSVSFSFEYAIETFSTTSATFSFSYPILNLSPVSFPVFSYQILNFQSKQFAFQYSITEYINISFPAFTYSILNLLSISFPFTYLIQTPIYYTVQVFRSSMWKPYGIDTKSLVPRSAPIEVVL